MKTSKNKQLLLEQLKKTPIIQVACEKAGVSRMTYYRWLKTDEKFAEAAYEAIDHGVSLVNDLAESQLISSIKDKNMTAIIYWLKSRHPAYEARLKLGGKVQVEAEELTSEQSELVAKALSMAGVLTLEEGSNGKSTE